jgi:hypothetical protein
MSSNLEFEQAKAIIANVQICQAHLKSTLFNLEMTIHWSSLTTRNLDLLSKFVTAELKRLKAEATETALKAKNNNNGGLFKFLTGGSSESMEVPAVEIVEVPAEVPAVEVEVPAEVPAAEVEVPAVEVEVPAAEVEVPAVEVEVPAEVPAAEVEVPAEVPAAEVEVPAAEVEVPAAEVEVPAVEVEVPAVEVPSAEVEVPAAEPAAEVEVPSAEVEVPAVEVEVPAEVLAFENEVKVPVVKVDAEVPSVVGAQEEVSLEGGKIIKITQFSLLLKKKSDDFKTIDLLVQTVDLLSIAQSFIINNEKFAFDEATTALECASSSLVIGEELEKHITNIQFDNSASKTTTLNTHRVSIQTFNSIIERLPSLLSKLFALSKNLQEDVNDTSELVDQVRRIIISRSSEQESYGILKWFTKQTNDPIKSDMILNAIETVFSSMDRVVFFSNRAFKEVSEIENKVTISLITFSTVPGLHSNKSKTLSGGGHDENDIE